MVRVSSLKVLASFFFRFLANGGKGGSLTQTLVRLGKALGMLQHLP